MEGMQFVFYVGVVLIAADRWTGNNNVHNVYTQCDNNVHALQRKRNMQLFIFF